MIRSSVFCLALILSCGVAFAGHARPAPLVDFSQRDGQVTAALAAFAFAAVPQPYNSLLFVDRTRRGDFTFRNGQIGGGLSPVSGLGLYTEGFIAAQDYAPEFVFGDATDRFRVPVRWRSIAGTAGVGWVFPLARGLVLRPTVNVSLGEIVSNSDVPDGNAPGDTVDFVAGGGLTVGGYGAALTLDYARRSEQLDLDMRVRHTALRLVPLGDNAAVDADIDAATTGVLLRARVPIDRWSVAGGPVRSVYEATYAHHSGDQGTILDMPWVARLGAGLEFETGALGRYAPPRTRVMFRYIFGKDFGAFGLGLGLSF